MSSGSSSTGLMFESTSYTATPHAFSVLKGNRIKEILDCFWYYCCMYCMYCACCISWSGKVDKLRVKERNYFIYFNIWKTFWKLFILQLVLFNNYYFGVVWLIDQSVLLIASSITAKLLPNLNSDDMLTFSGLLRMHDIAQNTSSCVP
jgi:hypothetical protein